MTLDQLAEAIDRISPDINGRRVAATLRDWKTDGTDVTELSSRVERNIGHTWFETDAAHHAIYNLWSRFRIEAISPIGGMTMNERLYSFSLLEVFDGSGDSERDVLYRKLLARD